MESTKYLDTESTAKAVRDEAGAPRLIPLRVDTSGGSVAKMSEQNGGSMDNAVERRAARRFSMMLPLKVRFSKDDDLIEKHGETRDVSFRGLYFTTEGMLETGASIEFVLTLPQQITLAGDVHIRCYARVLRVDPQNGNRGVAARIDRYEFLPAAS
jgi:PilZ domain